MYDASSEDRQQVQVKENGKNYTEYELSLLT